jgi:hypothetical protein
MTTTADPASSGSQSVQGWRGGNRPAHRNPLARKSVGNRPGTRPGQGNWGGERRIAAVDCPIDRRAKASLDGDPLAHE